MIVKENGEEREDRMHGNGKESRKRKEGDLESDMARNSVSSQVELEVNEDGRTKRVSRVTKATSMKKEQTEAAIRSARGMADRKENTKLQLKNSNSSNNRRKPETPHKAVSNVAKNRAEQKIDSVKVASRASPELSEGIAEKTVEEKTMEEFKEIDISDEAPNCDQSVGTDNETADTEENSLDGDKFNPYQKIDEMESRIEKLEDELREVAALEVSLYSVVPEHGSSTCKIYTPARRLSRLFIYSCKHWSQDKRATVAKNIASGLVLIAKSCGNDVARLTFWLSNIIVIRELISQALGSSFTSSPMHENGAHQFMGRNSSQQEYFSRSGNKLMAWLDSFKGVEDWRQLNTFRVALERIESHIFASVVDSVWWQTFISHMQSPIDGMYKGKSQGKMLGPALGDRQQGAFSINHWKDAFLDAFTRLCPIRAGGNECGCIPVLARMVMKHCVTRLDVAMFNAILRESANQMPTDPVSDPIEDTRILPIQAGCLSFGSGAQLKNAIGYWSRCLSDIFGIDADDSITDDQANEDINIQHGLDMEPKSFLFLNSLSDLLMLPKDLLIDKSVRNEVCPSISLPLVVRILCNFTPDEFCPDPVPCAVLEDLNTESLLEYPVSGKNSAISFPYKTGPVLYCPPAAAEIMQIVGEASTKMDLGGNTSIQKRGYTSDEELDEQCSPFCSILDRSSPISPASANGNSKESMCGHMRFELLREVWSA